MEARDYFVLDTLRREDDMMLRLLRDEHPGADVRVNMYTDMFSAKLLPAEYSSLRATANDLLWGRV